MFTITHPKSAPPAPGPPLGDVDLLRNLADVVEKAPSVNQVMEEKFDCDTIRGINFNSVEFYASLTITRYDKEDDPPIYAGVSMRQVLSPPAEPLPEPDCQGDNNEHEEARKEQLADIIVHIQQWVRNVLPQAQIQMLSRYEFIVTHGGRFFQTSVYWEGA
jgi:hypothetical protein